MDRLKKSIVHEYNVLYSNRIHQKDKKWVDGTLKYYEFNRKVQIYNNDGILIKLDFVSERFSKNFKENETFVLPSNSLLVQIDCYSTSYERDVSEFFKKDLNPEKIISGSASSLGSSLGSSSCSSSLMATMKISPQVRVTRKHPPSKPLHKINPISTSSTSERKRCHMSRSAIERKRKEPLLITMPPSPLATKTVPSNVTRNNFSLCKGNLPVPDRHVTEKIPTDVLSNFLFDNSQHAHIKNSRTATHSGACFKFQNARPLIDNRNVLFDKKLPMHNTHETKNIIYGPLPRIPAGSSNYFQHMHAARNYC